MACIPTGGPSGWFAQKKFAGGGALADMGIHALDTARFLLGDPQPVSVYARIGTNYGDFDVDDTGVIWVNWANGAISYLKSGWWQPHMDGPEASTQLYGSSGFGQIFPTRLQLPQADQVMEQVDPGFPPLRDPHCPQSMYDTQMAYFLECIELGREPSPGGNEGLLNMRVVDAAYKSAETGELCYQIIAEINLYRLFPEPNKIEVHEETITPPAEGEVLCVAEKSLISIGTESYCLRGEFDPGTNWATWVKFPFRPGYSMTARVIAVGQGVTGLKEGDRIAAWIEHQQYFKLKPEQALLVPEGVSAEEATWAVLACTTQLAVRRAQLQLGETVGLVGLGMLRTVGYTISGRRRSAADYRH